MGVMSRSCLRCGSPLPPFRVARCPKCQTVVADESGESPAQEGTRLESVEDLRRQLSREVPPATRAELLPPVADEDSAQAFHPTNRPPMAMVCVVDDGME